MNPESWLCEISLQYSNINTKELEQKTEVPPFKEDMLINTSPLPNQERYKHFRTTYISITLLRLPNSAGINPVK